MASSPRINTQLGARQTLELRRKARLPVHRPSACSGDLIAGDGTKNGLSRSEQKTLSTTQNNRLTGKAPYKSTANLTADDLLAGRAIKDAPLALGEDALNQRHNRKNEYEIGVIGSATDH